MNTSRVKRFLNSALLNLVGVVLILYLAGPFLWVITASFQGENELLRKPPNFIPQNPTTANYNYVFTGTIPQEYQVKGQLRSRISQEARLIAPALKNSFIVAVAVTLVAIVLGALAGFTFARRRFRAAADRATPRGR